MEPGPFSELNRTGTWRDYVTVTKLGITVGNMIAVFAGYWLGTKTAIKAGMIPSLDIWTMIVAMVGTALVIMAGTSLNNYIDRDLDQQMERTRKRPSATGALTPRKVLIFGFVLAILGTSMLLFVNVLTAVLGLAGLFVYVVVYTLWLKRTSTLSTVIGGISGAIPPIMGYAAASNTLDASAWAVFAFMLLWQPPHTLALAIRRVEDYRAANIPLLPVVRGFEATKRQSLRYVAAMVPVTFILYGLGTVGFSYLIAAVVLGIGYLYISVEAFYAKDDMKWAKKSFVYSLFYLITLFVMMIVSAN
ncbi:protoheme IX farnesyltransferase [Effusibacillus lacus]|uniref:Protoheme IX farnesyltransferase n=2 Tax=Effusibacillus lacus TaxID=1348429 RepID=A0A292YI29_9BACL|nr:protoheme IX farnesyltransferase [Effusibacillus lacus]